MSPTQVSLLIRPILSSQPPVIQTWRLTLLPLAPGSFSLYLPPNPKDSIRVDAPFQWPPRNEDHARAIHILLGTLPGCEGWGVVAKVLREMLVDTSAGWEDIVGKWIEKEVRVSLTGKKAVFDVIKLVFEMVYSAL
jgi:hypothetical protein